jgi:hypothetical protein
MFENEIPYEIHMQFWAEGAERAAAMRAERFIVTSNYCDALCRYFESQRQQTQHTRKRVEQRRAA